ncbi:MAG: C_GCAxxG_C_C family protein [Ruminiclostridium sp.]|nr:C_GCAxxG_C_C family protein [Ruminiclostridium sp.]
MGARTEKAVENHKSFYSCSASVLGAFADTVGMTVQEAKSAAAPFAGGRMGKCGAVLAAEYVIDRKFGDKAEEVKAEFEKKFTEMNRTIMCRELKGSLTGKPIRSCRGCVTDAAELLEKIINE